MRVVEEDPVSVRVYSGGGSGVDEDGGGGSGVGEGGGEMRAGNRNW